MGDEDADEDDIDPNVGARVMPSVGSFVEGACDIIGQNFIRTVEETPPRKPGAKKKLKPKRVTKYCMRIGPHAIYTTKIRRPPESGPIPDFIVDPSYAKLVAIENGEGEVKTRRKTLRKKTRSK